jgi:hypothetical protein
LTVLKKVRLTGARPPIRPPEIGRPQPDPLAVNLGAGKSEVWVFDASGVSRGPVAIWQADHPGRWASTGLRVRRGPHGGRIDPGINSSNERPEPREEP